MAGERPYLSVVVTARNDDHGGNLLGRMQAFVNGWIAQCKRHGLDSELILVEWNPPAERPYLAEALHWPRDLGPCEVRIIQVPPDLHLRYAHAEAQPLYQMIGKNAGIRRARGRFVLATNIDIIFSNELVAFLAERKLEPGRMYRIDRHDAMGDVPIDGIDEQLAYCETHLIRINAREGTFNLTPEGQRALSASDVAAADSGITFGPGWFPVERATATTTYRWATTNAELRLAPPSPGIRSLRMEIEPGPGVGSDPLEVLFMNARGERMVRATVFGRGVLRVPVEVTGEVPIVVRSLVLNGGRSIPEDTRILEFRLFRCEWDRKTQETQIGQSSILVGRAPWWLLHLWRWLQRLPARLTHGEDIVLLPVVVSPRVKRALKVYADHGGITGLLRRVFVRKRSTPVSTPAATSAPAEVSAHLHTNGCGDFTLMSLEAWLDLRGYPEFDTYSMHLDSVLCISAHHCGIVEEVLEEPMRIYHIEHGAGSGWTPEGQTKLFARLAAGGVSRIEYSEMLVWAKQMQRLRCPMIFSLANWGLGEFSLPETAVTGAENTAPA